MRQTILFLSLFLLPVSVDSAQATSYAESVISFNQGSQTGATGTLTNPDNVLGPPDWSNSLFIGSPPSSSDPYYQSYFNLGLGGEITVMMENWLQDGSGYDLTIVEIGASEEVRVYASNDLSNWIDLGLGVASNGPVTNSTSWQFEFSGLVTDSIRYVRLLDNQSSPGNFGADIDAVIGHHEIPEPATVFLVGLGFGSLFGRKSSEIWKDQKSER